VSRFASGIEKSQRQTLKFQQKPEVGLSEHTIKKYLLRIFDKVGTSSRVELVLYAMSHGEHRPSERMPSNALPQN